MMDTMTPTSAHVHCEAVIASLERQLAWTKEQLQKANARERELREEREQRDG